MGMERKLLLQRIQRPHDGQQASIISVPGDLTPSSVPHGHYTHGTLTNMQVKPIH